MQVNHNVESSLTIINPGQSSTRINLNHHWVSHFFDCQRWWRNLPTSSWGPRVCSKTSCGQQWWEGDPQQPSMLEKPPGIYTKIWVVFVIVDLPRLKILRTWTTLAAGSATIPSSSGCSEVNGLLWLFVSVTFSVFMVVHASVSPLKKKAFRSYFLASRAHRNECQIKSFSCWWLSI